MSSSKFTNAGLTVEDLGIERYGNGHGSTENGNGYRPPSKLNGSTNSKAHHDSSNGHHRHQQDDTPLALRGNVVNPYTYEVLSESAQYIMDRISIRPKIAIICGSGLGSLATILDEKIDFPYEQIPHFPQSTVPGHAGKLVVGKMGKVPVVCMQGRFHYYEGYPLWKCAMPVRVFKLLGVEMLIVTNAAGGLNPDYKVGDIMILKDHVNFPGFAGESFLRGPNDERFGSRFVALNSAYDLDLRKLAKSVSSELGMNDFVHEGIYTMVGGPNFETVAELRLMKLLGIDAVGMSTVPEVIAARHCGIKCFGFSLITNECVTCYDTDDEPDHAEVMEAAFRRQDDLVRFVTSFIDSVKSAELISK